MRERERGRDRDEKTERRASMASVQTSTHETSVYICIYVLIYTGL